jgi:hypothetical protein
LLLGVLISTPAFAAPSPKPKTVKVNVAHVVTMKVTGMA